MGDHTNATIELKEVPDVLGDAAECCYVTPGERFVVMYAASYGDGCDPTGLGLESEQITTVQAAAHWAFALTRDGSCAETEWLVFDRALGSWQMFHQGDIEALDADGSSATTVNRYDINDELNALGERFGVRMDDDTLNELTHHVADVFEQFQKEATS